MNTRLLTLSLLACPLLSWSPLAVSAEPETSGELSRVPYNHSGLTVDLGVGLWAWPLPMDHDNDGLMDLVVACTDTPYNGTYVFRNSGQSDPQTELPIFHRAERIGSAVRNPQISHVDGTPVVTSPNRTYPDFADSGFDGGKDLLSPDHHERVTEQMESLFDGRIRANQWRFVDYDGDGDQDLIVGIGYWGDYGWDDAYNDSGEWTNGPLHGYVYLLQNTGTEEEPDYADPVALKAGGEPIDVFGMPSPSFADFDGDGDLDLICGEFLDGFTYFQNTGSRTEPAYASGQRLTNAGEPLRMDLCMITPVAYDFNVDGHMDLIVGDEDGRVAFVEHSGEFTDGVPHFREPRYVQQFAEDLKFGALSSPVGVDWDGDGLQDIVTGNTAGYIGFLKNLGGGAEPRWAAPVYLNAGEANDPIRIMAGPNGSIQGPAEAKWGYSNVSVGDWDGDDLPDILDLGIWGHITLYRNSGTRTEPKLEAGVQLTVEWEGDAPKPAWNWWDPEGNELVAQWRSTPLMIDMNEDGLMDLVTLDPEGYLALYERARNEKGERVLLPPTRAFWGKGVSEFDSSGKPTEAGQGTSGLLRMNDGVAGRSGRRTFCFVDWDGDGVLDLLANSKPNVNFLKGHGQDDEGRWIFEYKGPMDERVLAGHSTTPTVVDWDQDEIPDLLVGAEDGFFYHLRNPRSR